MSSTSVTKSKQNAVSTIDFGVGEEYTGIQVEQKDIVLPRLQLLQKGVEWEDLNDIAWKPGDFYHTGINELVKGPFEALVVDMKVSTTMYGPKQGNGRRDILKYSADGRYWDDGTLITKEDRTPSNKEDYLDNTAVDSYHYVIIIKGEDFPVILTFKGASARNAKNLNFALTRMKPTWRSWVKFYSEEGESDGNKFKRLVGKVQPKRMLEDQDMANLAAEVWKSANATGSRVVLDESEDETPSY